MGPAATLAVIGDAKQMNPKWVRGCYFKGYGPSLMVGIGLALPVVNKTVAEYCAVKDEHITAPIVDFSIPRRVRPTFNSVSYAQLKSGEIAIEGQRVRTAPLSSVYLARQVSEELKGWIQAGEFELTESVAPLPRDRTFIPQDRWGSQITLDS